jgi:hypothetical protein
MAHPTPINQTSFRLIVYPVKLLVVAFCWTVSMTGNEEVPWENEFCRNLNLALRTLQR